jgi:hypothetical protein
MLGDDWEPEREPPRGDPWEKGEKEEYEHCDEFEDDD